MKLKRAPRRGDQRQKVKFAFPRAVEITHGLAADEEPYRVWLQRYVAFQVYSRPDEKYVWETVKVYDAKNLTEVNQLEFLTNHTVG